MKTLAEQWRKGKPQGDLETREFSIPAQENEDSTFRVKYDKVQKQLESIAGMDDLLSGKCISIKTTSVCYMYAWILA